MGYATQCVCDDDRKRECPPKYGRGKRTHMMTRTHWPITAESATVNVPCGGERGNMVRAEYATGTGERMRPDYGTCGRMRNGADYGTSPHHM